MVAIPLGPPDSLVHTLTLTLDSSEVLSENRTANNVGSITVRFCGWSVPRLTPGSGLTLGGQPVLWGHALCLEERNMQEYNSASARAVVQV